MQNLTHEDYIELLQTNWNNATPETREHVLNVFNTVMNTNVQTYDEMINRFEDTRTQDEVNDMVRVFAGHIAPLKMYWYDEDEMYVYVGIDAINKHTAPIQ